MGDRSTIVVTSETLDHPITLYGHSAGDSNLSAAERVLARTDRVGDPVYLVAQLFYEFAVSENNYDGNLGFGIATQSRIDGDAWNPTVIIDADTGEMEVS